MRLGLVFLAAAPLALAAREPREALPLVRDEDRSVHVTSAWLDARISLDRPALDSLAVDCLGERQASINVLADDQRAPEGLAVSRPEPSGAEVRYDAPDGTAWMLSAGNHLIRAVSTSTGAQGRPFAVQLDTGRCYSTLLGLLGDDGRVRLPAVLHMPGFGSMRIESSGQAGGSLGYESGPGWIRISFPAADAAHRHVEYRMTVASICPDLRRGENEARLDGFRRNWLNIFQLNPNRRLLSNNTNSDACAFCYYEYADIAAQTPPLADGVYALDMVRQSLDRILAGEKTYGMPGYGAFPEDSADTRPSLLITAHVYVEGRHDERWLRSRYPAIRAMAEAMLATDKTGDGLIKYAASGNSGSWNEGQPKVRPANWWDTIGFGYEDAYSNALAYRALRGMSQLARQAGHPVDARRFSEAARKLRAAYMPAFYVPEAGVIAGWRSADGERHNYDFLFVNGIAVLYGLVPPRQSAAIMDKMWSEMKRVGYTNFRMGLPGNLISVARRDYAHKDPRYGGGRLEDNSDGFQIYCNGGATASFSYFTIAAFDSVGQHDRASKILYPILRAFDDREFEGKGSNGLTNDWRKWDGMAEGYEGFLADNYYALLAVTGR
ncbi:MAG TPA: hypothetical protein VGG37_00205 [Opitutaceae bacterium]|jgi:hypothetical protein